MIIDELSHLKDYLPLHPALQCVADFLASHKGQVLPEGRTELDYPGAYVNVQILPPKAPEKAVWESHQKMIDVQVPLSGDEIMCCQPVSQLGTADYDAAKDITFYAERPEGFVKVRKGMFALFFPQDAHAPGVTSTALCKAVFKLPLQTK